MKVTFNICLEIYIGKQNMRTDIYFEKHLFHKYFHRNYGLHLDVKNLYFNLLKSSDKMTSYHISHVYYNLIHFFQSSIKPEKNLVNVRLSLLSYCSHTKKISADGCVHHACLSKYTQIVKFSWNGIISWYFSMKDTD